jgi:hypothetical protein
VITVAHMVWKQDGDPMQTSIKHQQWMMHNRTLENGFRAPDFEL